MTLDINQKVRTDLRDVAGSAGRSAGSLEAVEPRGALPARRGVGEPRKAEAVGGGGIASPLTVQNITYSSTPQLVETIDGSGLFRVRTIASLTLLDADGREVEIGGFGNAVSVEGA